MEWNSKGQGGDGRLLAGEQAVRIGECLELQSVAARIQKEDGGLLAYLAAEADAGFDDESLAGCTQTLHELPPLVHVKHHAEMRHRYVLAIDGVSRPHRICIWIEMGDDLVSVEIEIDPGAIASSLGAAEHAAVEGARSVEIVHRKRVMEWIRNGHAAGRD